MSEVPAKWVSDQQVACMLRMWMRPQDPPCRMRMTRGEQQGGRMSMPIVHAADDEHRSVMITGLLHQHLNARIAMPHHRSIDAASLAARQSLSAQPISLGPTNLSRPNLSLSTQPISLGPRYGAGPVREQHRCCKPSLKPSLLSGQDLSKSCDKTGTCEEVFNAWAFLVAAEEVHQTLQAHYKLL